MEIVPQTVDLKSESSISVQNPDVSIHELSQDMQVNLQHEGIDIFEDKEKDDIKTIQQSSPKIVEAIIETYDKGSEPHVSLHELSREFKANLQ